MSSSSSKRTYYNIGIDILKKIGKGSKVIGLGSGSTTASVVKEIARYLDKDLEIITTSLQIKIIAENLGLNVVDENHIPDVDIVFDGADQIDSKFNMIKGGGGALLKEKILISAAKQVFIIADSTKFVETFDIAIPIEVHPFARSIIAERLKELGSESKLRVIDKGYPFITENGNIIIESTFNSLTDIQKKELEIKNIPGVIEVGLFTRHADIYYKIRNDGFDTISCSPIH
jgi:ribose 5-phosphate isomerase A